MYTVKLLGPIKTTYPLCAVLLRSTYIHSVLYNAHATAELPPDITNSGEAMQPDSCVTLICMRLLAPYIPGWPFCGVILRQLTITSLSRWLFFSLLSFIIQLSPIDSLNV